MRLKNVEENKRTALSRVYEIYRNAVHFRMSSADIRESLATLYNKGWFARMPLYARGEVRAVAMHLFHGPSDMSIYQHLEYRMLYKGEYYASFDAWRAKFPDASAVDIEQGKHFYKGTDCEY
jgi:hypothetical protein